MPIVLYRAGVNDLRDRHRDGEPENEAGNDAENKAESEAYARRMVRWRARRMRLLFVIPGTHKKNADALFTHRHFSFCVWNRYHADLIS